MASFNSHHNHLGKFRLWKAKWYGQVGTSLSNIARLGAPEHLFPLSILCLKRHKAGVCVTSPCALITGGEGRQDLLALTPRGRWREACHSPELPSLHNHGLKKPLFLRIKLPSLRYSFLATLNRPYRWEGQLQWKQTNKQTKEANSFLLAKL